MIKGKYKQEEVGKEYAVSRSQERNTELTRK